MGGNLHQFNNGIMRIEQIILTQVQGLVDAILNQDLILAEVLKLQY